MFRSYFIVFIFILSSTLMFQGCGALKYLDNSSEKETKKFRMTKDQIWNEKEKLEVENKKLRTQIGGLQKERGGLRKQINIYRRENKGIRAKNEIEIARVKDQNKVLNEQINKLEGENKRIRDENRPVVKKLKEPQPKKETPSKESPQPPKGKRKLRIKVLSGDGDLNSAKEAAKKLRNMGYNIRLIDLAPRPNFSRNTVFFAPKFKNEAKSLAPGLGGAITIFKPLSWSSVFDIIVVTGKKSGRL